MRQFGQYPIQENAYSSLEYYRDSTAEEADELNGEISLCSCMDVPEYAVQHSYGFQIHTKDVVYTFQIHTKDVVYTFQIHTKDVVYTFQIHTKDVVYTFQIHTKDVVYTFQIHTKDVDVVYTFQIHTKEVVYTFQIHTKDVVYTFQIPTKDVVYTFQIHTKDTFQIHTKDVVYTLSVMTSGIRQNWIEALRKTMHATSAPDVTKLLDCNKENTYLQWACTLARAPDCLAEQEELERDLAQNSKEGCKWFEATDSRAPEVPAAERPCWGLGAPLAENQQSQLSEEIEKKWQKLNKLPLWENKQSQGPRSDSHEALEKEVRALQAQLEAWHVQGEASQSAPRSPEGGHIPPGYILQEACEHSLAEM
ncbi:hypothetical protein P7K49_007335 [Saguinus oedipus]|uniref:PH domain-containing protein n=1 Tax=Saguinus oedipus TaxID=9490 RepID=A0ABQ9VUK7_SAGOE|nr:hypothetical protein P7K49_007335 [Saguinus oedipus]